MIELLITLCSMLLIAVAILAVLLSKNRKDIKALAEMTSKNYATLTGWFNRHDTDIRDIHTDIASLEGRNQMQKQFFRIDITTGKAYFKDEVIVGCGEDINNINS